jgi:hypothetical protein
MYASLVGRCHSRTPRSALPTRHSIVRGCCAAKTQETTRRRLRMGQGRHRPGLCPPLTRTWKARPTGSLRLRTGKILGALYSFNADAPIAGLLFVVADVDVAQAGRLAEICGSPASARGRRPRKTPKEDAQGRRPRKTQQPWMRQST